MKQLIAFRVDSGHKIGVGHVMRCLTLATALKLRAVESFFICRSSVGSIEESIESEGFRVYRLPPASKAYAPLKGLMHGDFLACSQAEDAELTLSILESQETVCAIIVDQYGIDRTWDEILPDKYKIFKIDDLADREHDCDGLVDQNFYNSLEQRYNQLVPVGAALLLGPKYALLRPQFRDLDIGFRRARSEIKQVLVSFGGQDPNGYALQVAGDILKHTKFSVNVMGVSRKVHESAWQELQTRFGVRLQGPAYLNDPLGAFDAADIYIGAGGTITWERFACGLPGIVYSVAENQVEMARDLESAGMQTYAGNINHYNWIDLARHLEPLSDAVNRWLLSQRLRAEVDGKGVERVIEEWGLGG